MEWFFKKDGNKFKYYIHLGEKYYSLLDGDGQFQGSELSSQGDVSTGFKGSENADAIVGKVGGFGRYRYIIYR